MDDAKALAAAMIAAKFVPGSAAQRAETAAEQAVAAALQAETAADSVTTATVAEIKTYLNIP